MTRTTRPRGLGRSVRNVLTGVAAAGAALTLWGTQVERHLYTVRREHLPALAAGQDPLRILHIADLHLAPWQHRRVQWIRSLRHLNPDVVVITGDLMGHREALPAVRRALIPFANVPGVFVYGSNDYYGPILKNPLKYLQGPSRKATRRPDLDTEALTAMLTGELGFVNINNRAADLHVNGTRVRAFGLGDPHIRYDNAPAMHEALRELDNQSPADTRIGVVHAPYREACDALLAEDADLIFSGHTHGGQVRIPGIGALTTNSDLPPAQARGVSTWFDHERATFLHVSAGIGHSLYAPVRIACRPEANVITLTARAETTTARSDE